MTLEHRRIVLKIGTNTLCDPDGMPDVTFMQQLAKQIQPLRGEGYQFIIVSSGAVGHGRAALKLQDAPDDVPLRQACAAVGQPRLMRDWADAFMGARLRPAQVLVTSETFEHRRKYQHFRDCIDTLLKYGAVPIINENDTVATEEIDASATDNDRLGALVAGKIEADMYIFLSDVQGLFDRPPHQSGAKLVTHIDAVDDATLAMVDGQRDDEGMRSKLVSARGLTEAGIPVAIVYGRDRDILRRTIRPEEDEQRPGTWIEALGQRDGFETWFKKVRVQGRILVDEGAADALREGFQLLPAGVKGTDGRFPVEAPVEIMHGDKVVARAISQFSDRDLGLCCGMQSDEAREVLGIEGSVNVTRKGRILVD